MKKSNIFSFILGAIIFGGISVVSAYALLSSDVSYTPEDQGWNVENVQDALDDLNTKVNTYLTPNHFEFRKGNNDFKTTNGEVEYTTLGVKAKNYVNRTAIVENELDSPIVLNDPFEISTQVFINNTSNSYGGYFYIKLYQKENNEYTELAYLNINDAWAATTQISFYWGYKTFSQGIGTSYTNAWTTTNPSGRYAIVGKNNKIYLYRGEILLGSTTYDLSDITTVDKISIEFWKYNESAFAPMPTTVEDIYVGDPLYYRSIVDTLN